MQQQQQPYTLTIEQQQHPYTHPRAVAAAIHVYPRAALYKKCFLTCYF
jgi:hypothetical protein